MQPIGKYLPRRLSRVFFDKSFGNFANKCREHRLNEIRQTPCRVERRNGSSIDRKSSLLQRSARMLNLILLKIVCIVENGLLAKLVTRSDLGLILKL